MGYFVLAGVAALVSVDSATSVSLDFKPFFCLVCDTAQWVRTSLNNFKALKLALLICEYFIGYAIHVQLVICHSSLSGLGFG